MKNGKNLYYILHKSTFDRVLLRSEIFTKNLQYLRFTSFDQYCKIIRVRLRRAILIPRNLRCPQTSRQNKAIGLPAVASSRSPAEEVRPVPADTAHPVLVHLDPPCCLCRLSCRVYPVGPARTREMHHPN